MATEDGVLFLSRLVAALHLVLGLSLGAGVRFISQVLELAGLDPFMATSVRWHQDRAQTLERSVRSFGREEGLSEFSCKLTFQEAAPRTSAFQVI